MKGEPPFPAAVTYHRVSTADQDPTLARDELRRAVALRELALVEEVEEVGSGARNDRPGMARVMELAAAGQVTHVLCWKLDRFGRSALDVLTSIERLNRMGVTFVCTSQHIDVGPRAGAIGRMTMTVLAAVAEFERELIRERTRVGQARAVAKGRKIGRPLKFPPALLARAADLRAAGLGWRTLARQLTAEGRGRVSAKGIQLALGRVEGGGKNGTPIEPPNSAPAAGLRGGPTVRTN